MENNGAPLRDGLPVQAPSPSGLGHSAGIPSAGKPDHIALGSLDYRVSWPRPATPCDLVPLWAGEFHSHADWVSFATKRLTGTYNGRSEVKAICVDALGRRCHDGGDMARARDEDAFPVRYFWECIPAQAIETRRAETQSGSVHESAVHAPKPNQEPTNG